jgi:quercetin dioxygenase-like cupin family protein
MVPRDPWAGSVIFLWGVAFMNKAKPRVTGRKNKPAKRASKKAGGAGKVILKGTIARQKVGKGQLRHIAWSSVEVEALNPLLGRHFVVGQNVMLARVLLKKGCVVPEHSHHNEQITHVTDGALKFWIDGQEIVVSAGEVLTIPPNIPHRVEALEDSVTLDIFDPPRADWIDKTDAYLR